MDRTMEGVDSKALLLCLIKKIPALLILAVAGALAGSGLAFLVMWVKLATPVYVSETEYYIDFAEGRLEARDYYNDFTWNDVLATDPILGKAMETLGDGYVREQVRNMITADILSDVRYLTITIRGMDAAAVGAVQDALQAALESYGDIRKEFASIQKIEDSGVVRERIEGFPVRAALLGAVLFAGIGIFVIAFRFGLGDCIYTKADITKYFGIPVYGLLYKSGNRTDGRQERMLAAGIEKLLAQRTALVFADCAGQGPAAEFVQRLETLGLPGVKGKLRLLRGVPDDTAGSDGVVISPDDAQELLVVIPYGVPCRRRAADEIDYLRLQGYKIIGAVLADVDKRWMDLYMNEAVHSYGKRV